MSKRIKTVCSIVAIAMVTLVLYIMKGVLEDISEEIENPCLGGRNDD